MSVVDMTPKVLGTVKCPFIAITVGSPQIYNSMNCEGQIKLFYCLQAKDWC